MDLYKKNSRYNEVALVLLASRIDGDKFQATTEFTHHDIKEHKMQLVGLFPHVSQLRNVFYFNQS